MIKSLKRMLKKINNHGSSFVLVIVSTTFLSVLVSALLMGAMMTYKLKYYKVHSLNNFYSTEKAMDEIYAGIGATANEYLYNAYTTTAELVVVYDDTKKEYVNLDNDQANELFRKLFMKGITNDNTFKSISEMKKSIERYISDSSVSLDASNLKLVFEDENGNQRTQYFKANGKPGDDRETIDTNNIVKVYIKNIGVRRDADLSDVGTTSGVYEQSITTDIVLVEPEYTVSFDISSTNTDSLFNYAILADMGVEITDSKNVGTDVLVKGNVYAASDFYNKDYNGDDASKVTALYDKAMTTTWGSTKESAYSGIYVNGEKTKLTMNSDVVLVPGSVSAFDGAAIQVSGRTTLLSELWADNMIIDGSEGGSITASANAYIYDDTELNADKSTLSFMKGRYFGYSYTTDDIRSINLLKSKGFLATGYDLKSHFSDSAIIVNGKDSTLDLKNLDTLYIAGKSYIEFSKVTADSVDTDAENAKDDDDDSKITVDSKADYAYTNLKDYSTGQSLDVKSNQLMFLTQWAVVDGSETTDEDTGITTVKVTFPASYDAKLKELYDDYLDTSSQLVAIKQTVSGHDYYYLYIEKDKNSNGTSDAEEFVEAYYALLKQELESVNDKLYNVVKYEDFPVRLVLPDTSKMNTSGAVTSQNSDKSLYFTESVKTTANIKESLSNASKGKTFQNLLKSKGSDEYDALFTNSLKIAKNTTTDTIIGGSTEEQVSNFITYMYINMKDHLDVLDKVVDEDAGTTQNAWETAGYTLASGRYNYSYDKNNKKYSYDYSITPLNNYVDYKYIFDNHLAINEKQGESVIIVNEGAVNVSTTNADGSVQGIIIATGNVTFDDTVKSFRGLIITGSKLKCDHDVEISADALYVSTLLEDCVLGSNTKLQTVASKVLTKYKANTGEKVAMVSGVSISDISYKDILSYENWKKNIE